jgi:hypothetical protein
MKCDQGEANFRHSGFFSKVDANFLNKKFAEKIGKFLGYFLRQQLLNWL